MSKFKEYAIRACILIMTCIFFANSSECLCLRDVLTFRPSIGFSAGYRFYRDPSDARLSVTLGREAGIKLFKKRLEVLTILRFHALRNSGRELHSRSTYGYLESEILYPSQEQTGLDTIRYETRDYEWQNRSSYDLGLKFNLVLHRWRLGFGGIINGEAEHGIDSTTIEIYEKNGRDFTLIEREETVTSHDNYFSTGAQFYPGLLITLSYLYKRIEFQSEININGIPKIGVFAIWHFIPND